MKILFDAWPSTHFKNLINKKKTLHSGFQLSLEKNTTKEIPLQANHKGHEQLNDPLNLNQARTADAMGYDQNDAHHCTCTGTNYKKVLRGDYIYSDYIWGSEPPENLRWLLILCTECF